LTFAANSQSEAIQLAFLTFLPSIFFSGYIFPRETMPKFFYILSYFVPASYYINSRAASSSAAPAPPNSGSMPWRYSPSAVFCW
jgi:ABC-type multidrug transport system permease subunit